MTPIAYLQHRIEELEHEQPVSLSGQLAKRAAIQELERCVLMLKVDAVRQLQLVQQESETVQ